MTSLTADEKSAVEEPALSTTQRVAKLMELALERLGATGPGTPAFSTAIREEVRLIYPAIFDQITESTFSVYLNKAPAENPRIISLGTARGYYLDRAGQSLVVEERSVPSESPVKPESDPNLSSVLPRVQRAKEAKLYPHVENWLIANGYRAKVVSEGKSLGPWGNPDVVGIQALDILGYWHAQTVSVEVKLSSQNWQRDIFEAISHRRYFDRCYFCYPVLANNRQVSEEMKDYAELYDIGIILVELAQSELEKLNVGDDLDSNYLSVTEVCPAPFHAVMPKYRKLAFSALDIGGLEGLFRWGRQAAG